MKDLLQNHRVVVCTGSGGVGKTTISAALGVAAASMGKRVLVLTIDPARRLATALGIENSGADVRVPGQRLRGELWAASIDPARIFADYIERHSKDRAGAERLLGNTLYRQLSTTLSGSQEFTALSRLVDAAGSVDYDLVVLDTPPAAHASDFLQAPARLNAVFDSAIVSLFMGRTPGFGFATMAWKNSVKLVLGALTLFTGSSFVANFSDFFSAIDAIAPDIRATNQRAQRLLVDPSTAFVLVTSFDAARMAEGHDFHRELTDAGYHLEKVVVNRAWPDWVPNTGSASAAVAASLKSQGAGGLGALYQQLAGYYAARRELPTGFDDLVLVREMEEELVGLPALERLAERLMAAR